MNCRARIYDSLNIPAKDRLGNVKWKDLAKSNEEFPILKHVKGRRVRHFIPVVCELARRKEDRAKPETRHVLKSLQALSGAYDVIGGSGVRFTALEKQRYRKAIEDCLRHYQWCGKHAFNEGKLLFSMVQNPGSYL